MDTFEELPVAQEARRRVGDLHSAFPVDAEVVMEHSQWRGAEMNACWDANHASASEWGGRRDFRLGG